MRVVPSSRRLGAGPGPMRFMLKCFMTTPLRICVGEINVEPAGAVARRAERLGGRPREDIAVAPREVNDADVAVDGIRDSVPKPDRRRKPHRGDRQLLAAEKDEAGEDRSCRRGTRERIGPPVGPVGARLRWTEEIPSNVKYKIGRQVDGARVTTTLSSRTRVGSFEAASPPSSHCLLSVNSPTWPCVSTRSSRNGARPGAP